MRTIPLALLAGLAALSQSACLVAVVGAGAGEAGYVHGQKDRTTGEVMSDQWLYAKVSSELGSETGLESKHISVEVRKGVVILSGMVPDDKQKKLAVAVTRSIKGVKDVADTLQIP